MLMSEQAFLALMQANMAGAWVVHYSSVTARAAHRFEART